MTVTPAKSGQVARANRRVNRPRLNKLRKRVLQGAKKNLINVPHVRHVSHAQVGQDEVQAEVPEQPGGVGELALQRVIGQGEEAVEHADGEVVGVKLFLAIALRKERLRGHQIKNG